MVVNNIKIPLEMKNKGWLSADGRKFEKVKSKN